MIDWLFKSEEIERYTYDEVKVPIRSSNKRKFWHRAAVRYNDEELEIRSGPPKRSGWKPVESDNLRYIIEQQL